MPGGVLGRKCRALNGGFELNGFMGRLAQRFQHFMTGRYGSDKLNMVILVAAIVLEILYAVFGLPALAILSILLIGLAFFRMFSKNREKRAKENHVLLQFLSEAKMLRKYHIYRCPGCRQKIRVPRKGGMTVDVSCPKCGTKFRKKI